MSHLIVWLGLAMGAMVSGIFSGHEPFSAMFFQGIALFAHWFMVRVFKEPKW